MIWKEPPHIAAEGEKVFVIFKNHDIKGDPYPSPMIQITVSAHQPWNHIKKWCFVEEMERFNNEKIKESILNKKKYYG
jgi:hypothetical protein